MSDVTMMLQQPETDWLRLMREDLPAAQGELQKVIGRLKPHQDDKRRSLKRAAAFITHVHTQYIEALARKAEQERVASAPIQPEN